MIRATIKATELTKMFRKLGDNAGNLRPPLIKIGGMLERTTETAFERQGPGWKALTPKYKARKIKKFGAGKKILEREGDLAGSVSSQIIGASTVVIGSVSEYARPHQLGSPKQGIPARPYLIVGEAEITKSIFIISKHLVRGV